MRWVLILFVLVPSLLLLLVFRSFEEPQRVAYVIGPRFPGRQHLRYLAVSGGTGIECIYIMRSFEYDPAKDLENNPAIIGKIQRSEQLVKVPAGTLFDIVVVVRAVAPDNIAAVNKEYFRVVLLHWTSTDPQEYVFESSGYGTRYGYLRANVVFDNDGDRFVLQEGETLRLDYVRLEVVGK